MMPSSAFQNSMINHRGGVQKKKKVKGARRAALKHGVRTALSIGLGAVGGVGGQLINRHLMNPARSNRIGYVGNAATKTHR